MQADEDECGLDGRKERARDQDVDLKARRAADEGRNQDGDEAVFPGFDGARRLDGGHVASRAHDEGDEALAVQPHQVHQAIHDEGGAGHVARVFQEGDAAHEQHDHGHENHHRADAGDDAIHQQAGQFTRGNVGLRGVMQPGEASADPVLRILAKQEGQRIHGDHDRDEDGDAQPSVREQRIQAGREIRGGGLG